MDQLSSAARVEGREVERDRPFNPYRFAASENAKDIVREAIGLLSTYEVRFGLRRNKRRPKDQETFEQTVEAILSDLIHGHLVGGSGIFVTRSNRVLGAKSRYRPAVYSKAFPATLDLLSKPEMGYVEQDVAPDIQGVSRSTVIRPGQRLLDRITEHDVDLDDFDTQQTGETIILKRLKDRANFWDDGERLDYPDDGATDRYRAQMAEINQWLHEADLKFDWKGIAWPHTPISLRDRRLRRVFTQGRFDSGGRLFGGFWQQLRKDERRVGLRISGEKAVELDYGQAGARILYGMAGRQPTSHDLYRLWGYVQQREGIKRVMSAMIFADKPLERFPQFTRKLFRSGDKIADVVEAIEQEHEPIRDRFHRGLGHEVQFIESQIMVEVLLVMKARGITALPIHDALMVPASAAATAREMMLSVFQRVAGVEGIVTQSKAEAP
ncbi:hypothetical protein [Mesorhizobium humile]|uniref:DNA-directed DNA polymerase family A palm domain-containing protein n=1 Tax=Mesorhizobium humile TaxID=3072313 RepID=A0ABU4Y9I7_9HYPH|nr:MULTISPECIES: hypothetical protein [unclassified Mesorhizobium]MDX8458189.1 hypothetical protein [Mesorhizobium sp. VK2D]MDX8483602.1 hypothetical protein [Mesorhizobium sp. VK2B]